MFEHTVLVPVMFTVKVESDSVEERQARYKALRFISKRIADFVLYSCESQGGARLICSDAGPTREGMRCATEFYPDSDGGSDASSNQ